MSFGRPMAHHARSTNIAAPQHTMLIPRLSATETCLEGDQCEAPIYSNPSFNNNYLAERGLNDIPEVDDDDEDSDRSSVLSNGSGRQASIQSFTASSHYSHRGPFSHARSHSRGSDVSKNYNDYPNNATNESLASSQHLHPNLYARHYNASDFSVDQELYRADSGRKLYIANLAKDDILSDDDI